MINLIKYVLAFFSAWHIKRMCSRKISNIYMQLSKDRKTDLPEELVREHKKKWGRFVTRVNPKWLMIYSDITSKQSPDYIPEDIYYAYVEPVLNNKTFSKAYTEKNLYDNYYKDMNILPVSVIKCIDGVFYNINSEAFKPDESGLTEALGKRQKLIIKISVDSGGGRSVELIIKDQNNYLFDKSRIKINPDILLSRFGNNFIIQEYIQQHPFFASFNPSSLNTMRILTYRSVEDEQIVILQSLLRIGKAGNIVDNQASGGISLGINSEGKLNSYAIDKYGNKYYSINGVEFINAGFVPEFAIIKNTAIQIALRNPHARLLGLDLCLDHESNVKMIELNNSNNEINFYQMNNGPLFREYTNSVIDYCLRYPRSYCFDFNLIKG